MNLGFLNTTLLSALLPLLALPLAIHLLNRHFPQLFRFSTIERIKATMARRSRLHRWRHLILLLLRTLMLLLLLLAFLKPVAPRFGSDPAARGQRQVLLLLDHSLSMEHKGDGPAARARAIHEAENLLGTLGADDLVNVILIEQNPGTCFVDFSKNHSAARHYLQTLPAGLTRGDVNQANALAARLLTKAAERVEVYYFSDFQRKNWANADFRALPAHARLFFVDAGARKRDNRAVLEVRPTQAEILAGDTVALEITVGNFSDERCQDRLTVALDKRPAFDQEIYIAPWSVGKFSVPVPISAPGLHLCKVSLPPDALEQDNHFFVTLPAVEKEEVLIVTDDPPEKKDTAWFLATALNPYPDLRGSLLPRQIPATQLTSSRLAGVKKVLLTHAGRLSDEAAAAAGQTGVPGRGFDLFPRQPG